MILLDDDGNELILVQKLNSCLQLIQLDLQARIQVSLFSILEEKEIQGSYNLLNIEIKKNFLQKFETRLYIENVLNTCILVTQR